MAKEQTPDKEKCKRTIKYVPLSDENAYDYFVMLSGLLDKYLSIHNLTQNDIIINKNALGKLIGRVDKRKQYFIIFHDETYINEIKEMALFAYWIIKFSPFTIKFDKNDGSLQGFRINEGFAAFIIFGTVKEVCKRSKKKRLNISKEYCEKLMYALKYWDLSKEALILVAETLNE